MGEAHENTILVLSPRETVIKIVKGVYHATT